MNELTLTQIGAQLKSAERENKRLSQSVSRYQWSLVGVTAFSTATLLIIGLYQ